MGYGAFCVVNLDIDEKHQFFAVNGTELLTSSYLSGEPRITV